MTDQTALAKLVAKWRAEAKPHRGATGDEAEIAYAKDQCADELESALPREDVAGRAPLESGAQVSAGNHGQPSGILAREGTAAEGPAQGEAEK